MVAVRFDVRWFLARGKWDLPRIADFASKHAERGRFTLDKLSAFMERQSGGSCHVHNTFRALWEELRDSI